MIVGLCSIILCLLSFDLNAQSLVSSGLSDLSFYNPNNQVDQSLSESPYFLSFESEKSLLIGTAGLFGIGLILQQTNKADPFSLEQLEMLDRNNINSFDRGATNNSSKSARSASDIIFHISMGLPSLVFLIDKHTRSDVLSLFIMSAESLIISGGLNLLAKHAFNRARPYTYNNDFSLETRTNGSSRLSFFSGHTSQTATATFFIAKVISDYHPRMKTGFRIGMWSAAIAIPAVTGYLRVESGRHYNSDVIAGFGIGAFVGWLVPHLNRKKKSTKFSFTPYSQEGANGLSLVYKINK